MSAARLQRAVRRGVKQVVDRFVIQQAGGIVVRRGRFGPEILLVTTRRSRKRWVLPKGTIKRAESARQAAAREVLEETGLRARVVSKLGLARYPTRDGLVQVQYFLMERPRSGQDAGEGRETLWCAIEDAIARLTYASARRVLLEAYPRITTRLARDGARHAS
jgi:8-oxo-dGTP pyrophosphatase MutT (NUDIX family)